MVVGGEHDVETGIVAVDKELVGRAELRIAGVGRAAERGLEIGYRHIGTLNLLLHIFKAEAVVVCAIGFSPHLYLLAVLHQVASEKQRDVVGAVRHPNRVGDANGISHPNRVGDANRVGINDAHRIGLCAIVGVSLRATGGAKPHQHHRSKQ